MRGSGESFLPPFQRSAHTYVCADVHRRAAAPVDDGTVS
jgi:hypothetical protein